MAELFVKIFNIGIATSWLVLAIIVMRFLFKKAPKWLNPVLWGIVGLRLLFPVSIESTFSMLPSATTISPTIMDDGNVVINSGVEVVDSVLNPIIHETMEGSKGEVADSVQSLIQIASVIWGVGIIIMLSYAFFSYLCIHMRIKTAVRFSENIYQSEYVTSPFVMGLIRPRIYLPFNISDKYAGHVIAHEQTHIIRHDHWFKPIGFLLLAVYWFNPLLWIAYVLLCRDIELACDERVVKDLEFEARADYSQALLSCSISRKVLAVCPLAFGEVGVKARVKNVLNYKKPAFWIVVTAVILSVGLAVGFLTNPINKPNYKAPFECVYEAKEILYDQTIYSFTYIPNDWLVRFYATEDTLYVKNDVMAQRENETWVTLDGFAEIELTKENFDNYFRREGDTVAGWHDDGNSASKARKNNFKAWRVIDGRYMYYLLQQNDGSVYIACGYYDSEGELDPYSDDSEVWRMFRLEETSEAK